MPKDSRTAIPAVPNLILSAGFRFLAPRTRCRASA